MGWNNGDDFRSYAPIHNRSREGGVPACDNCRTGIYSQLDRENKPVTKRNRNRSPRLQQSLQVLLGRLLKSQNGFSPVTPVRMATRQKPRLGNPHAIFIPANLNLGDRNNHAP